jgi:hypothetical protein
MGEHLPPRRVERVRESSSRTHGHADWGPASHEVSRRTVHRGGEARAAWLAELPGIDSCDKAAARSLPRFAAVLLVPGAGIARPYVGLLVGARWRSLAGGPSPR